MIKTQVQIPEALYRRAKAIAAAREISFAEVVRRGLEYITSVMPEIGEADWELPQPLTGKLNPKLNQDRLRDLTAADEEAVGWDAE